MDATQPVATTPRVLHRHAGRALRRLTIGLLVLVLLGVIGLVAFARSFDGRILPGVVVGGVAVGGMTEADARSALDGALGALEDGQIQLVSEGTTGVISYAEVGRAIDDDGMLAEALGHGRGATRLEEAIAGLQGYLRPTSVPIRLEYDRTALATKLAAFRALGARAATDARARMLHGTFLAMPAHEGVTVDTHVRRLANRMGFTKHQDPAKIERDLMPLFARESWTMLSHLLIWHGRRICSAGRPNCP